MFATVAGQLTVQNGKAAVGWDQQAAAMPSGGGEQHRRPFPTLALVDGIMPVAGKPRRSRRCPDALLGDSVTR